MAPTIAQIKSYEPLFRDVSTIKGAFKEWNETKKLPLGGKNIQVKDYLRKAILEYKEDFREHIATNKNEYNNLDEFIVKLFKGSNECYRIIRQIEPREVIEQNFKKAIIEDVTKNDFNRLARREELLRQSGYQDIDFDIDPVKLLDEL